MAWLNLILTLHQSPLHIITPKFRPGATTAVRLARIKTCRMQYVIKKYIITKCSLCICVYSGKLIFPSAEWRQLSTAQFSECAQAIGGKQHQIYMHRLLSTGSAITTVLVWYRSEYILYWHPSLNLLLMKNVVLCFDFLHCGEALEWMSFFSISVKT